MYLDKQKALLELGIPEDLYNELLQDFVSETGPALKKLFEAVQSGNLEETARGAHFIKGAAGNLRINEMYCVSKDIEFSAKGKADMNIIKENVLKLKVLFEELKKIVEPKE